MRRVALDNGEEPSWNQQDGQGRVSARFRLHSRHERQGAMITSPTREKQKILDTRGKVKFLGKDMMSCDKGTKIEDEEFLRSPGL